MTAGGSGDDAGRSGPLRSGAINPASRQLTLTARLNTSAVDSRRGVVRLHPSAVAALGIREWDAVSLIGSRTTAAVAGLAGPGTPVGTVLLDDVTLSNAGLREGSAVVVGAVTVYGARSVTLSGSTLASQSITPDTLRQALLGKVVMVGDAVSLLPRDLGPGTSTSAATRALATAVGISWTSELLTVTGVDPVGPVSVQPNSLVTWGTGDVASGAMTSSRVSVEVARPEMVVEELKGTQPQAAKLVEWLKLALDEPHLLKTLGAGTNLGVLVSGPAGVGKVTLVRAVCGDRRLVTLDGPEVGALATEDRLKAVASAVQTVRDGGGVLLITDVDALLPAAADPVASLILGELRTAVASDGVALIATSARPDQLDARLRAPTCVTASWACRCPTPPPAKRCWNRCSKTSPPAAWISTRSPHAHRVSSSPTWPRWCARRRCARRRGPVPTAGPRAQPGGPDRRAERHQAAVPLGQ